VIGCLARLLVFACVYAAIHPPTAYARTLFDAAQALATAKRMDFAGRNDFAEEQTDRGLAIRSTPRNSASGLYEAVDIPGGALVDVSWSWRVDRLQPHGDLRSLATEDSGAVVFFVFGEPSMLNRDVPTIAYLWSATPAPIGSVIQSLRYASLRYVQLRGSGDVGAWRMEKRNVAADFRSLFGRDPPALGHVAIFNDNDQTHEPATALFGDVKCADPCR